MTRRSTRTLLRCGAAAGPLFVATFLAEGALRPGYDPLRHPVSSLALGPRGWVHVANFATAGALYLAGAVGLARTRDDALCSRVGPVLVGAAAVGLLGSAAFPTDPVSGYPQGTPDVPAEPTPAGVVHDLSGVATFLGIPAAALVYARSQLRGGRPRWAACSGGTALTMLATFVGSGAAFNQAPSVVRVGGLLQRASIAIGFSWLTALCAAALVRREGPRTPA
ncbi:DUF998 domain-containing protein [Pseudonocardia nigra]|uniref:DUF998 domain-containing protein n=1 Tax=Pseudonocardia nigra TaxID=1921578 RepID=UPI0027E345B7|nr:DUF998 domain-containing protein [Pseudonocardia nigra]